MTQLTETESRRGASGWDRKGSACCQGFAAVAGPARALELRGWRWGPKAAETRL